MQTIVILVSGDLGLAWIPESVRQFQRSGVVDLDVKTSGMGPKYLGCIGAQCRPC